MAVAGTVSVGAAVALQGKTAPPLNDAYSDGVAELYATMAEGRKWNTYYLFNRGATLLTNGGGQRDTTDPEILFTGVGQAEITGDGMIKLTGDFPRIHIIDTKAKMSVPNPPVDGVKIWKNIEMTAYFYAESQNQPSGADTGIALEARLGDFGPLAPDQCLSYEFASGGQPLGYSYNTFIRYNQGKIGIQKEVKDHGAYTADPPQGFAFGGSNMPYGRWFGVKFIVRNYDGDSKVRLETYLDRDATNVWTKIGERLDSGGWTGRVGGVNAAVCPARPLDMIINWGTPDIRIRADYANSVWVKWLSCREIDPLP